MLPLYDGDGDSARDTWLPPPDETTTVFLGGVEFLLGVKLRRVGVDVRVGVSERFEAEDVTCCCGCDPNLTLTEGST
jgi:hypothetical protein